MQKNVEFLKQFLSGNFISEYNHSNHIDNFGDKKYFHMDCSGFIYWCLAKMGYKRALVELRTVLRKCDFIKINRFFCKDFVFIHTHKKEFKYWDFINTPIPGSILVVVFPDGNGHCMFINKVIKNNKNKLSLRITDSTRYPHKNDTRTNSGIGSGEIEIIFDNNDYIYNSNNPTLPLRKANIYFVLPKN